MRIDKNMSVSAETYFSIIVETLLMDINQNRKVKINASDLKEGFIFEKKINMINREYISKRVVEKFDYNKIYQIHITYPDAEQIITHIIETIDDNLIHVIYKERIKSNSFSGKLGYLLRSWISRFNMINALSNIEQEAKKREQKQNSESI